MLVVVYCLYCCFVIILVNCCVRCVVYIMFDCLIVINCCCVCFLLMIKDVTLVSCCCCGYVCVFIRWISFVVIGNSVVCCNLLCLDMCYYTILFGLCLGILRFALIAWVGLLCYVLCFVWFSWLLVGLVCCLTVGFAWCCAADVMTSYCCVCYFTFVLVLPFIC